MSDDDIKSDLPPQESDDFSMDPLPMEYDGDDGDDGGAEESGLELDALQSDEMRQIFGVTLPQYLQPVEEMLQQILGGRGDEQAIDALEGTVDSLRAAAGRMGFDNVVAQLDALSEGVFGLRQNPEDPPQEARGEVLLALEELKDIAVEMGGGAAEETGESLYRALAHKPGVAPETLQRLSAAGLVTVEQLLSADQGEVAAVSGLSPEQVDQLLSLVRGDEPAAPETPAADAVTELAAADSTMGVVAELPAVRAGAAPATESGGVVAELPLQEGAAEQMLKRYLQEQVDVEADVQELRAELHQLQARVERDRAELRHLRERRQQTTDEVERHSRQVFARVAQLSRVRAQQAELTTRHAARREALQREEQRIAALNQRRRELASHGSSLDQELAHLTKDVRRVLRRLAAVGGPRKMPSER